MTHAFTYAFSKKILNKIKSIHTQSLASFQILHHSIIMQINWPHTQGSQMDISASLCTKYIQQNVPYYASVAIEAAV